jgi:hypothetical protein
MFIGDIVKLRPDVIRYGKAKDFVQNGIKEGWLWLITSIDDEDLDYTIQPLYLDSDNQNMTQLGAELLVLCDEIEKVELSREKLFEILRSQIVVQGI